MKFEPAILPGLEGKLSQPNMIMEFNGDWLYLQDVQQKDYGFVDTYKFRDDLLIIDYTHDEFRFRLKPGPESQDSTYK